MSHTMTVTEHEMNWQTISTDGPLIDKIDGKNSGAKSGGGSIKNPAFTRKFAKSP